MNSNEYKCSICHEIFPNAWSEEEAEKELEIMYSGMFKKSDCNVVCEDCYQKLPQWVKSSGG